MKKLQILLLMSLVLVSFNALAKKIEGTLYIFITDSVDFKTEKIDYAIKEKSTGKMKTLKLKQNDKEKLANFKTGDNLTVEALADGSSEVSVESLEVSSLVSSSYVPDANGVIVRDPLFVSVNYSDAPAFKSKSGIEALLPGLDKSYRDSSFGKFQYNFDHNGDGAYDVATVTINYLTSTSTCFNTTILNLVKEQLSLQGWDVDAYFQLVMYVPQEVSCMAAGMASRGFPDSIANGVQQYSWIFSETKGDHFVSLHEMGHNNGLGHGTTDGNNDEVIDSTYGDKTTFMGNSRTVNMNVVNMVHLGFYSGNDHSIQDITAASSIVDLSATDVNPLNTNNPSAIRVFKNNNTKGIPVRYILGYRRNVLGYDVNLNDRDVSGVNIYKAVDGVDFTSMFVKTLQDGEVFDDSVNGVKITQLSRSGDVVRVKVELTDGAPLPTVCVASAPTMSFTSSSFSMDKDSSKSISVNIKNNDNSYCSATTFNLNATESAALAINTNSQQFSLAPGASVTKSFIVSSGSTLGKYSVAFNLEDNDNIEPGHNTVSASIAVEIVDLASYVPTAPTNLSARTRKSNAILNWTLPANTTNISKFRLYSIIDGQYAVVADVSKTATSYSYALPSGIASVSYVIRSVTSAGIESADSNKATITLSSTSGGGSTGGGCKGKKCQ